MTDYPFRWLYQPRGGYGYTIAVPCRILFEEQGMRTKIAALRADGTEREVYVKPESLVEPLVAS